MRRHLARLALPIFLGVAMAACAAPPAGPPSAADMAAINTLRDNFVNAFNSSDAQKIVDGYTADAITLPAHHAQIVGKDAILAYNRDFFSQMSGHISLKAEETKTAGDWGFDRGTYTMTVTPKAGGAPMNDQGKYIVIIQKQSDGSWKLTRDIDNSDLPMPMPTMTPPQPPEPVTAKGRGRGK